MWLALYNLLEYSRADFLRRSENLERQTDMTYCVLMSSAGTVTYRTWNIKLGIIWTHMRQPRKPECTLKVNILLFTLTYVTLY